jgi:uncharacterized membrane protein (DUF106 family)
MKGWQWLLFVSFVISIFVGLLIYDNYEGNHYRELNLSFKPIIPSIPFYFENVIFVIVVILIIFGIFIGTVNYVRNR